MLQRIQTRQGDIRFPAYGRLDEIHKVLTESLAWTGLTVTINGWGYSVTPEGFISNDSINAEPHAPGIVALIHPGMAILIGQIIEDDEENQMIFYQIITTAKIHHVIDRCICCGDPLVPSERKRRMCYPCYARETA